MILLAFFFGLQFCIQLVSGHIFMQDPPSRRNKYSEYYVSNGLADYNLMAPLLWDGASYTYPCKGYPKGPSTKTINGNTVSITLEGSATHGGGHCQFGVTYDDNTFVVLKTVIGDCLISGMSYNLELPNNMPSGDVTVFWTWVNRIGNREYYMECADVTINNPNGASSPISITGKELLVVNYPGYPTIPEGLPAGNDGTDLLNARKDITISSGSTSSQPQQPPSPPQPPPPPPPQQSTSTSTSTSSPTSTINAPTLQTQQPQIPSRPVSSNLISSRATFYFRVGDDQPGCPTVQTFNDGNIYGPCNARYGAASKYWAAIKDGGKHCGELITVTYGSKSMVLTVMDECPACASDNHVDMSLDALIELTGSVNAACAINTLQPQITWSFGGNQLPIMTSIMTPTRRRTRYSLQSKPTQTNVPKPPQQEPKFIDTQDSHDFTDYEEFKEYLEFKKYQEQYEKECEDN